MQSAPRQVNVMKDLASSAERPSRKGRTAIKSQRARRARLLIAEDDWAFRDLLVWALGEEGCDTVAVGNGAELLDILASSMLPTSGVRKFDLVVTALNLPGWGGLTALENLNKRSHLPPIVVITALGSDEIHDHARRVGAVAVSEQPFDVRHFLALARNLLARET